jgi:hypothetical protein
MLGPSRLKKTDGLKREDELSAGGVGFEAVVGLGGLLEGEFGGGWILW